MFATSSGSRGTAHVEVPSSSNGAAMVLIRLLGGVSLEGEHAALTGRAAQRHRIALIALLAITHPRGLSRDKLIGYLWPENDARRARNLLSQAVHALRKALGPDAILTSGDELRLNPDVVTTDVWLFREAMESAAHERAVELYGGAFLDGFFLGDSIEFERWTDAERDLLRGTYLTALRKLADDAAAGDEPARLVPWLRRLAAEEPYNSSVVIALMDALEAAGDRGEAIRQAESHAALLRRDLEAEPTPEVMALAERMRTAPLPAASAPGVGSASGPVATAGSRPEGSAPVPGDDAAGVSSGPDSRPVATPSGDGAADPRAARARRARKWAAAVAAGLAVMGLAGWFLSSRADPGPAAISRVAVLPLANLMGDARQDYFVAGMHDALIAELSQIDGLTVMSRQSVIRYGGSDEPLPVIARELGVDALVEGSVFLAGDSVRITVQLLRAEPEEHLWAATRTGALRDALGLQAEVARALARAMHPGVAREVEDRLARRRAASPEAQHAYLRGLYHLERAVHAQARPIAERLEDHRTAISYLEEAVALDPEWAAAHARLARARQWLAGISAPADAAELLVGSKAAALRALELDEGESHAHAALGLVLYIHEWDWTGAERAFSRALELDPNSHHWIYARYLQAAGRHDEAISHFRQAQERNPLSDVLTWQVALAFSCAGRADDAIEQAHDLESRLGGPERATHDGFAVGIGTRPFTAFQLSLKGDHDTAIAIMEENVARLDSAGAALTGLAYVYARAGRHDDARELAGRLEAEAAARGGVIRPAQIFAALGETSRALDMVEEAFEANPLAFAGFRCTHTYRMLASEPRMQAIIDRIGFPG